MKDFTFCTTKIEWDAKHNGITEFVLFWFIKTIPESEYRRPLCIGQADASP